MMVVVLLCVAAGVGVVCLLVVSLGSGPREMRSVRLRFGTEVTTEAVEAALTLCSGVSGLSRRSVVVFDVLADQEGIDYRMHAPQAVLDALRGQLSGVVPGVRIEPLKVGDALSWSVGARIRLSGRYAVLRSDGAAETTAALLGSLAPLSTGERVLVRWRLSPGRSLRMPRPSGQSAKTNTHPLLDGLLAPKPPTAEHLTVLRRKHASPVLVGEAVVLARAGHPERASHLTGRVVSVLRSRSTPHGRFAVRSLRGHRLTRATRTDLPTGLGRFSPSELAAVIGWPINAPQVPGLELGAAPLLMPSHRLPATGPGRIFATATWPGMTDRPLLQPVAGAMSHSLILGPTGVGKSALITNLISQDVAEGHGALLLDMKGDTASDVLARIPKNRMKDVIVLEPASGLPVPGLRVFGDGDPELVADMLLGTFRGLFKDSWGVRSDQYLRQGFVTLAEDADATLADLIYLFTDPGYRRRLVGKLDDPMLQAAWAAYEAMSPGEQAQHLASPLRKIQEVVGRKVVRAVLAQSRPRFDLHDVLASGKVVIVSLSPGRLGAPAVQLLGALVVYQLYSAVLARQAIPEAARRPFAFYLDEPKVLGSGVPIPLDAMFELFRGMACSITLGGQAITQLPKDVQRAALTNASTLVAFRQSRADAEMLARELPGVSAEGLQHLGRFEVAARIGLGPGDVASVTTGRTLPPSEPISDADTVRRESAERYGVDPAEVDTRLRKRHEPAPASSAAGSNEPSVTTGAAPVGRRRRTTS